MKKRPDVAQILGLKGVQIDDPMTAIRITREGLPKSSILALAQALDLPSSDMVDILPISLRTLQRYKEGRADARLSAKLSDHMVQVSKVLARTIEVFESAELAKRWMKEPLPALGGQSPLSLLDTSSGGDLVMTELVRIEYGVFS